jgi:hypothetical protein
MTSRRALLSTFLAAPAAVKLAPFVKPAPLEFTGWAWMAWGHDKGRRYYSVSFRRDGEGEWRTLETSDPSVLFQIAS